MYIFLSYSTRKKKEFYQITLSTKTANTSKKSLTPFTRIHQNKINQPFIYRLISQLQLNDITKYIMQHTFTPNSSFIVREKTCFYTNHEMLYSK